MANTGRTPLFTQVSDWLRQAQAQNRLEQGITRRTFLKGAAATGATVAGIGGLSSIASAGTASSPRILIVGAGIAGLMAADKLQKSGYTPMIYEGSNRVGGRIWSGRGIMGGNLVTEIGGEFIDSGHKQMRKLARRFNLDLIDVEAPSEQGLKKAFYFRGHHRTEAQVIAAFQPLVAQLEADQNGVELNDYTDYNQLAFDIDNTPLDQYLTNIGATGWIKDLLDVAYLTEYGGETSQQSALNLVYLIGTDTSQGFSEFGESDQRYKVKGGNDQITTALAGELDSCIQLGMKLIAVKRRGSGFRCTFQRSGGGCQDVDTDYLLLTIPFSTLRDVDIQFTLPSVLRHYIDECGYGTNAKLVLGFESRYWRNLGYNGLNFNDLPIQSGWDSSQLQPGSEGTLTVFTGGQEGLNVANGSLNYQRNRALNYLEQMFPGAQAKSNGRAFRFNWPTYAWSKGSYTCFSPGQYTSFVGAAQPVGNLYFAGEHLSFDYQGYMEGGAVTGKEAAEAIIYAIRH